MADWISVFAAYRVVVIRNDEVVQGVLHPELDPEAPQVRTILDEWEGMHFLHQTEEGSRLTLVRPLQPRRPERWWLHLLLALATLATTTLAGAYFRGRDPLRLSVVPLGTWGVPVPSGLSLGELATGLGFSIPLLLILLAHELGHYLTARRYRMDVSPPYFIPAPPWINVVGTFGAFIRLRSATLNRVVLLDVGAAGPLASFLLSLPVAALGLLWSRPLPPLLGDTPTPYLVAFGGTPIWLGSSLAFDALAGALHGPGVLHLHPLAFAGWLGLFVTALNLFPLAQLDGGHILYALVGSAQRRVGVGFLLVLLLLGWAWWGWWMWALLVLVIGRGSIRHPAVFDPTFPVNGPRRLVGWLCVLIFLLAFVPVPLLG